MGHDFHICSYSQPSGAESNFFPIGSLGFCVRGWLSVQGPEDSPEHSTWAHLTFPAHTHWPGRELLVEAIKHFFFKLLCYSAILLLNDFLLTTVGMIDQERFSAEQRRNFTFQWGPVLTNCSRGSHSSWTEVARAHQKARLFWGILWQCPKDHSWPRAEARHKVI